MVNNTTKKTPKVSIGMPVFNGGATVRDALESLLAQTFADFELIISDNGSTDDTEEICREYDAADERIRYVRQPENRGAAANWAFVLDQAVGEYFMWAAHDDLWDPSYIYELTSVLDADSSVGVAFSGRVLFDRSTGSKTPYLTGYTTSKFKLFRYLFRVFQCEVLIIYGLHRINVIRSLTLMNFDYYDVYLSRWYELESSIRIVPKMLFYVGTTGNRIPHSVTGPNITYKTFFTTEFRLLRRHFGVILAPILLIPSLLQRLKHHLD